MPDDITAPAGGAETVTPDIVGDTDGESSTPSFEDIAKEKGWKPKEEWEGGTDKYWVDAETFVKNQPLIDKIGSQKKRLKELEKTVEALAKHYQTNITQAKERAILDLKAERREAIELGEVNKVEEIDQKIVHVEKMNANVVPVKNAPPELEQFLEEQKDWFNKDEEMTAFAVAHNDTWIKKNPGNLEKSLQETLKAVRKAFPEKFENQRRANPSPVEGSAPVSKGEGKYSISKLNAEQKLVYKQLVGVHKQLSHDEYFRSLEEAGFLDA